MRARFPTPPRARPGGQSRRAADDDFLYLVLEFVPGGELFGYLKKVEVISEQAARFYAAQLVLVFGYLHDRHIIYRDLKPENLLLDTRGYLRLIDFSFGKRVLKGTKTYTLCGTPEYLAPEVLMSMGHDRGVDWWTLGCLIYEMLVGVPPFDNANDKPLELYTRILSDDYAIPFPRDVSKNARSLVKRLCDREITKRLGCGRLESYSVKKHRFFWLLSWRGLKDKLPNAPYVPLLHHADDLSHFTLASKEPPTLPAKAASWPDDHFDAWG